MAGVSVVDEVIDYKCHELSPNYRNHKLTNEIPEEIDCAYLASCALLIKREVVEQIGVMRRDFIYF